MKSQRVVLASTSIYRSELLLRLGLKFQTQAPDVDETPQIGESAKITSWRLSRAKAQSISSLYQDALIIGSDQVAFLHEEQIGKPLTHANAILQLQKMSGQTVIFYTALTLLNSSTGNIQTEVAENRVTFRKLNDLQIERYLTKEQPYHCAGSCKSEGMGILLISRIEGDDPNALIGLPLILLVNMLIKEGVDII